MSATAERSGQERGDRPFVPVPAPMCRKILPYTDKYFLLTSGNAAKTRNTGQVPVTHSQSNEAFEFVWLGRSPVTSTYRPPAGYVPNWRLRDTERQRRTGGYRRRRRRCGRGRMRIHSGTGFQHLRPRRGRRGQKPEPRSETEAARKAGWSLVASLTLRPTKFS